MALLATFTLTLISLLSSSLFTGSSADPAPGAATVGVEASLAILQHSGNFTTVLSLLRSTGIDLALGALDQVTFLAPSDAAFRMLPPGELGTLSRQDFLDILDLHAVPRYLTVPATLQGSFVSFSGETVTFTRPSRSSVTVHCGSRHADVVSAVFDQSPVSVYTVNRVLLPERLQASTVKPDSVPAPPPLNRFFSPSPTPAISPALGPGASLSTVLRSSEDYNTLVSLLSATGVQSSLESLPSLTFFAPSDEAFAEISKEVLRELSEYQLAALLKFHAVEKFFPGFENITGTVQTLASKNGGKFKFQIHQQEVETGVNRAELSAPMYAESPRLAVFALDKVLLPLEIFGSAELLSPATAPAAGDDLGETVHSAGVSSFCVRVEVAIAIAVCWIFCC